jgi:hypothetical protein
LAELAAKPPPKTGGTYIVQGGGDVVIQDETGKVIRTYVSVFHSRLCFFGNMLTINLEFRELVLWQGVVSPKFTK